MNKKNKGTAFWRKNLFYIFLFLFLFCLFEFFGAESAKALPPLPPTGEWVNIGVCTNGVDLSDPSQPVIRWTNSGNPQNVYRVLVDEAYDTGNVGGNNTSFTLFPGMIDFNRANHYYYVAIAGGLGWTPWASGGQFTFPRVDGICAVGLKYCAGTTLTTTTSGLCSSGRAANVNGNSSGPWTWDCKATGGGVDQNGCQAGIKTPVSGCATVSSPCPSVVLDASTPGLCNSMSSVTVAPSSSGGYWNWSCKDTSCGTSMACPPLAIQTAIIPSCGSDDGRAFCGIGEKPGEELCNPGTPNSLPGSVGIYEDWTWTCTGSCPAVSIDCSAKSRGSCGWIETN